MTPVRACADGAGVCVRFVGLRMCIRWWGSFAHKLRLAFFALCLSCGAAAAQSNVHTFSCASGFSSQLCKGSCSSSENNPVDNLHITGVSAGSVISFNFSNVGEASSTQISISNQNSTTSPASDSFSVPPTSSSQFTVTSGTQANFQVSDTSSPSSGRAKATYTVSCTPPPPAKGHIKFIKNTDSSANNGTFTMSVSGGTPATVDVATSNGTGTVTQDYDAGSYAIGETPPAGWTVNSIS